MMGSDVVGAGEKACGVGDGVGDVLLVFFE